VEIDLEKLRKMLWGKSTEVAQILGIAPENLSRKVRGHHRLTLEELNQISTHLRCDVDEFLLFTTEPSDEEKQMREDRADVLRRLKANQIGVTEAEEILDGMSVEPKEGTAMPTDQGNPKWDVELVVEDLIKLHDSDVDPRWIKAIYDAGMTDLSVDQVIDLANHDIEVEWLTGLRGLGIENLSFQNVIALAAHDVEIDWLRALHEVGLTGLSVSEIIELSSHDVDVEWIKQMKDLGLFQRDEYVSNEPDEGGEATEPL
jgi:DNA-binding Xre family transcriptional regulator